MRWNIHAEVARDSLEECAVCPEVQQLVARSSLGKSLVDQIVLRHADCQRLVDGRSIDDGHRLVLAGQIASPHLNSSAIRIRELERSVCTSTIWILMYSNEIFVGNDGESLIGEIRDVVAEDQRRLHERPHCELKLLFIFCKVVIANLLFIGMRRSPFRSVSG